jgi:hypothetical protein
VIFLYLMVANCIINQDEVCGYGERDEYAYDQWFSLQSVDDDGVSFEVFWDGEQELLEFETRFSLVNGDPGRDCPVALYLSQEEPEEGTTVVLDVTEGPPASVEGLGNLVWAANLPRAFDGTTTRLFGAIEVDGVVGSKSGSFYLSVATCGDAGVKGDFEVVFTSCAGMGLYETEDPENGMRPLFGAGWDTGWDSGWDSGR